jgi:hypothetical protein
MSFKAEDTQRKKAVGGRRNPHSPTTISCGLINTNANIIILQLFAKYDIVKF